MSANYVRYIKELRPIVGSFAAAILWEDLVFKFKKHTEGFWKFLKPCKHTLYKPGDSWVEELGFKNESEFRTAFAKIGIAYTSKKKFEEAENPFIKNDKEYFFASYRDRTDNLTHYRANTKLINETTKKYLKDQKSALAPPKPKPESKPIPKAVRKPAPKPAPKPEFEFDKFNWPQQLEKTEETAKILNGLDNKEIEKVLAVFEQTVKKNGIKKSATGLLAGLVNKHKKGELVIGEEITAKLEHNKWKQKVKECPYCDDEGYLEFEKHNGEKAYIPRCDHPKKIKWDYVKRVITARPGYQTDPDSACPNHQLNQDSSNSEFANYEESHYYEDYQYSTPSNDELRQQMEAEECPYCNEKGRMDLQLQDDTYTSTACDHKEIKMSWQIDGLYVKKILSAKEGYGDPPIRSSFWSAKESIERAIELIPI
jgi:sarcosine oxidase delta subunit